jgi:hypothetical protein
MNTLDRLKTRLTGIKVLKAKKVSIKLFNALIALGIRIEFVPPTDIPADGLSWSVLSMDDSGITIHESGMDAQRAMNKAAALQDVATRFCKRPARYIAVPESLIIQ